MIHDTRLTHPRIFLSAGEPSGDLHGARVAEALRRRWPDAELFGLGGDRMAAAGVELLAHVDQLAIMGFVEVLRHLPYFVDLMGTVKRTLRDRRPDLVLPIDYPGFNLRLARHARERRIPVLYYIAPQVWAWHRSRMKQLARNTDRLAVILPFETDLFRTAGADASFVGHPLLDDPPPVPAREEFLKSLNVDPARPVLALFPGSRAQEVERQITVFAAAAEAVRERMPEVQPVLAESAAVPAVSYTGAPFPRTPDGWALLHHARAALVKSGTSTLQAALAGTPLVVTYRVHPVTFFMAERLVRVPHVGLVNLVAGERIAPELLQNEATPARLAAALLPLLEETGEERRRAVEGLARVRELLTPPDASRGAAD
ncbi:MAG TPA: lipid-A-disaccharide synthase, partial [Longimicrobiales bacterium]|nr:lipid-A-disaccharide synthase [Longimicrobiales bacterium]